MSAQHQLEGKRPFRGCATAAGGPQVRFGEATEMPLPRQILLRTPFEGNFRAADNLHSARRPRKSHEREVAIPDFWRVNHPKRPSGERRDATLK
jgi:hypothetical protein